MENYILKFVSELVGEWVGEFKKTDQRTNRPTDQLCFSFRFLNFDILFPRKMQLYGLSKNFLSINQNQCLIKIKEV